MTSNKRRGSDYERYIVKRSIDTGFIDVERQPLSGQLPQIKYKLDVRMSAVTLDNRRIDFIMSCKKTINRNLIQFETGWIDEAESIGSKMKRTPIIGFSLGGKPGQKNSVHVVVSKSDFVRITGNIRNLNLRELKFRGKKYMTITREKLDSCRYRVGSCTKFKVCCIKIEDNWYYVFEIEDFFKAITEEYHEEKEVNRWF